MEVKDLLPVVGLFLTFLSIVASVMVAIFLFISNKSSRNQEKQEDNGTKLILSKIELSETRMMGKLDNLTSGQVKMEKKIEELESELRDRREEAKEKAQNIEELRKKVDTNEKWIEELKGRYKTLEQNQGIKNVTDLVLTKR